MDVVNVACASCVCRDINAFSFLKDKNILTVFWVNTSSGDFIQDHVLGTAWKAALHAAKHVNVFNNRVQAELFSRSKGELRLLRREELAARRIWVAACVGTGARAGLVAPLAHDAVRDDKSALCQDRRERQRGTRLPFFHL